MKRTILGVLLIMAASNIMAEDLALPNFKELFLATRAGTFINQRYDKMAGVYTTALAFHDSKKTEYVNLNIGYLKNLDTDKGSPMFQVGLRLDNLLAKARSSPWGQLHTSLSPLPTIEFGPFLGGWFEKIGNSLKVNLIYGVGLALGFK